MPTPRANAGDSPAKPHAQGFAQLLSLSEEASTFVGVFCRVAIELGNDAILQALADVRSAIPDCREVEIREQAAPDEPTPPTFVLTAPATDEHGEILLGCSSKKSIAFSCGARTPAELRDVIRKGSFDRFLTHVGVLPSNVRKLDKTVNWGWRCPSNQDAILLRLLLAESPLRTLVGTRPVYDFRPRVVFAVDEDDSLEFDFATQTSTTRAEVQSRRFSPDSRLQITCSITRTHGIEQSTSLAAAVERHIADARSSLVASGVSDLLTSISEAIRSSCAATAE